MNSKAWEQLNPETHLSVQKRWQLNSKADCWLGMQNVVKSSISLSHLKVSLSTHNSRKNRVESTWNYLLAIVLSDQLVPRQLKDVDYESIRPRET